VGARRQEPIHAPIHLPTPYTSAEVTPGAIRRIVLEQSKRANVGHIGSALSVAEIIATLYDGVLELPTPGAPERDRFILSKGHAALALYAALHLRGWLTHEELDSYCADATLLGVHPERALRGVDFSTGSLGQGLSLGVGAALAGRMQRSTRRVFVLLSDAECNEGSVWEAAMFAAQHRLGNLVAIVDQNRQQALGPTDEILCQRNLAERWRSFGWQAVVLDGHDARQLRQGMQDLCTAGQRPGVVVAQTVFGKGVSYMERQVKWHYFPMSDAEYAQALQEQEPGELAA
jgi:transketolase